MAVALLGDVALVLLLVLLALALLVLEELVLPLLSPLPEEAVAWSVTDAACPFFVDNAVDVILEVESPAAEEWVDIFPSSEYPMLPTSA